MTENDDQLFFAVVTRDATTCRELIASGADVNARHADGDTPLMWAIFGGSADICRQLLDHGADLHARSDRGLTPLHRAADLGRLELCELFLSRGADLTSRTPLGLTPLHFAASTNSGAKVCELLIANGAELDAKTQKGDLPVHFAGSFGPADNCQLFVSHGYDGSYMPAAPKPDYLTPFQCAIKNNNARAARFYIEHGNEDLAQRTVGGKSLMQLAGKNDEIKGILRSAKTERSVKDVIPAQAADGAPAPSRAARAVSPL